VVINGHGQELRAHTRHLIATPRINPFHVTPEISCLEALALLVCIYLGLISVKGDVSPRISAVRFSQQFYVTMDICLRMYISLNKK